MFGNRKIAAVMAVAVGICVGAGGAIAADQAGAVQFRQANMKAQGGALGGVIVELRKDAPDMALVAARSAKLKELSAQLPSWFPAGSGAEAGVKTRAKADIWSDGAGFAAAADHLKVEAAKLDQLAASGDLAGVKTQVMVVRGACKACHDKYQTPETPAA